MLMEKVVSQFCIHWMKGSRLFMVVSYDQLRTTEEKSADQEEIWLAINNYDISGCVH